MLDCEDVADILSGLNAKPMTLGEQMLADASMLLSPPGEGKFSKYRYNALGYFREVLNVRYLSESQIKLLELVSRPADEEWHRKLAIGTGVNFGKTFFIGGIASWYYDAWGPCIVATTAPSQQSVVDLLWKEVRMHRGRADAKWGIGPRDFIGPEAPAMKRAPNWWARGYVAAKGENWKGRHEGNMCLIFDEAVGLMDMYFRMTKTMFKPNTSMLWICCYNPTDSSSPMCQEVSSPDSDWVVVELSSLDHPNIIAGLRGEPEPIPAAVSLDQLEAAIVEDCESVDEVDKLATDFEFPPGSGQWWRPNGAFESDYMGRWPSSSETDLWSDALWKACTVPLKWKDVRIEEEEIPRIGCDVACEGDDKTGIHVSWGDYSVHHQEKGQVDPMRTCGDLVELADHWAEERNKATAGTDVKPITGKQIPIMIDDDGAGGVIGARLRELGYRVIMVGAATLPTRRNRYPNKRSELWFVTKDRGKIGKMHLGLLPLKVLIELQRQAKAPTWTKNSAGQREVEPKKLTKKRLGRSPDGMDSCNLSYYVIDFKGPEIIQVDRIGIQQKIQESRDDRQVQERRPLLWRGGGRSSGGRGLFRR